MTRNTHGQLLLGIIDRLAEGIASGEIPAGQKLSETALAKRFDTSRGPIREALRCLDERGLIQSVPNIGARVATYSLEDLIHLFHAREALEGMAARLAAVRMSQEEKTALREIFEQHSRAFESAPDGPYQQDPRELDFHYLVAKGSGNTFLSKLLCEDLYLKLRLCRGQHRYVPGRGRLALSEHRRVLEAIEDGDGDAAELLMRRHIAVSRKNLEEHFPAV